MLASRVLQIEARPARTPLVSNVMAGTCFGGTFHRKVRPCTSSSYYFNLEATRQNLFWPDLPGNLCLVKIDLPSSVPSRARKSSIATTQTACGWSRQSFNDYSQFHLGTFLSPFSGACFNINLFPIFQSQSFSMFLAFLLNNKFLRFCTDGLQM